VRRPLQAAFLAALLPVVAGGSSAASPAESHRVLSSLAIADLARAWVVDRFRSEIDPGALELAGIPRELVLPAGEVLTQVTLQAGSPATGHLTLLVEAMAADPRGPRVVRSTTVGFRVAAPQDVVVAVRELPRGSVITAEDVRLERQPSARVPRHALTRPAEAIGKEVVRPLAPAEVVTAASTATVRAIRRGATVNLVLEGPGFRIIARGIASEDGSVGQTIRVVNQSSRRELVGKVVDERTVRLSL